MKPKNIQTTISPEEFLRLKALCIIQGKSLKHTMREAILLFLENQTIIFNKGEDSNGQEINKEN